MGTVYAALHEKLGREVAIKVLNGELGKHDEAMQRFQREAELVTKLGHPNIVAVYDFGLSLSGAPYFVMEVVSGQTLRQRLERGPLSDDEMITDRSLRLELGEKVKLGKEIYEVVGLTSGMVGSGGDGLGFFSVSDAESIQFDQPGEASRLERQSRRARAEAQDIGRVQPELLERAVGPSSGIPALAPPQVSAVMLTIQPGMSAAKVAETIATWPDVTVYSKQQRLAR